MYHSYKKSFQSRHKYILTVDSITYDNPQTGDSVSLTQYILLRPLQSYLNNVLVNTGPKFLVIDPTVNDHTNKKMSDDDIMTL